MLSSAFKKLAKENNLKISNGIAYGNFRGYNSTFSDGAGTKRIDFAVHIPDYSTYKELENALSSRNLKKDFRVNEILFDEDRIVITFHDNPGTMKRIMSFLDWFIPLLSQYKIGNADICPHCGQPLYGDGCWKQIDSTAYFLHRHCCRERVQQIEQDFNEEKANRKGSYLTGFIGALIGGLLGAVIWAFVLYSGYIASIIGFLIGFFAEFGYRLLHGRSGKLKFVILLFVSVFCVIAGTFGADFVALVIEISAGNMPYGFTIQDIIPTIILLLQEDTEYRTVTISNLFMGFVFACLGMFSILIKTLKENKTTQLKDLN